MKHAGKIKFLTLVPDNRQLTGSARVRSPRLPVSKWLYGRASLGDPEQPFIGFKNWCLHKANPKADVSCRAGSEPHPDALPGRRETVLRRSARPQAALDYSVEGRSLHPRRGLLLVNARGDISSPRSFSSSLPGSRSGSSVVRRREKSVERAELLGETHSVGSSRDVSDSEERPAKRTRADSSKYAWAASEFLLGTQLRPEVQRTLDLIRVYGEDVTQAKRDLAATASAPEFPDAEWTNVLLGRAIDLDHVFSGQYVTATDDKISERIGELELRYRPPVPAKKIHSFGDWVYAWNKASVAIAFAFPHRRSELATYGDHIIALFGALAEPLHTRVLEYDRAVRKRVGSARRYLLTDFADFADLKIQFIDSGGVLLAGKRRHVETGTAENASTKRQNAGIDTYAPTAGPKVMQDLSAIRLQSAQHEQVARPKFLRSFVWDDLGSPAKRFSSVSYTHPPLLDVPLNVRCDPVVNSTLRARPDLFEIVTPINVDRFAELVADHPNQDFAQSVVKGLREGFWPYADSKPDSYPDTWDEVRPPPATEQSAQFLRDQRDEEIRLGRYSQAFGPNLLPGMYCMPVHVVPKPHSDKFRLVNDQSAGSYSLNSLIRPEAIKGAVLDGIPALGDLVRRARARYGSDANLLIWKSDVSQAYRRLPVSKYWQIRQVVTIDGQRHVDRCNLFGGRASLRIFSAFNSLVHWIAEEKAGVGEFVNYVDDDAGVALLGDVLWYEPFSQYLPSPQARLLSLWDYLGIPHERAKQLAGLRLPFIGFAVDPNTMTVTLPDDARAKLLSAIHDFGNCSPGHRRRSLAEFQAFAGYANWAFNVFPALRPALSNIYDKMSGKSSRHAGIYINAAIISDLAWFAQHVERAKGIHLLTALAWTPADLVPGALADEFALTDASACGIGIFFPWHNLAFYCPLPSDPPRDTIFFFEALAVCMAIHRVAAWRSAARLVSRLAILSDNSNTVAMFNSFRASPPYNSILKSAVDVMLQYDINPPRQPWSRERLVHERAIALGYALDKSTKLAYSSALNSYLAFVHIHHFPIEPSVDNLSFFVTYMSHQIEPRSVEAYLSGICSELEPWFPDVRAARRSSIVSRTLKGCKRLHSKPIQRKRALTSDDLISAVASVGHNPSHDDLLFIAILLTGFHALMRLGEFVWPDNRQLQSYRKVTLRATVHVSATAYEFTLPSHKADPFFQGSQVIVRAASSPPNPLLFFSRYLQSRDHRFALRTELWIRHSGAIPTRSWFISRLHDLFPRDVAGHSMRAGGATSLASAGVPPATIQALGRWSTDTWICYIRKHPALLSAMLVDGRSLHDGPTPTTPTL
ncbi:hypothetical protein ACG7TL_006891 [Trametes sanguinea]